MVLAKQLFLMFYLVYILPIPGIFNLMDGQSLAFHPMKFVTKG